MNRSTWFAPVAALFLGSFLLTAAPAMAQSSSVAVNGQSVSALTTTSAQLNGTLTISPWGASGYFQYGTSSSYGSQTPSQGLTWSWQSQTIGMSASLTGLLPGTTYHYRAVVVDGNGWGTAYGSDGVFNTPPGTTDGGLVVSGPSASNVSHSYIGQTNGWATADIPPLISSRWNRVWNVSTTGSLADTVTFGFDFVTGGVSTYGSNYMLLYRSGTSGTFRPMFLTLGTSTAAWVEIRIPASQLQAGEYTLGQAISGTIAQVPASAASIQAGVNAVGGGVVIVAPGTYNENVNVGNNTVTIMSNYGITGDTSYISRTIINGNGSASVITLGDRNNGAGFIGLTIQNGSAGQGGGAYMGIYSSSTWQYCYFYNNKASANGGAIYSGNYGTNTVSNCLFSGNSVNASDRTRAYGGAICQTSYGNMSVTNCNFVANKANGYYNTDFQQWTGSGYGGAIDFDFFSYGSLTLSNSTFTGNIAQQSGGAIYNGGGNGGMSTYNCTFNGNYGGGTLNGKARKIGGDDGSFAAEADTISGGAIFVDKGARAVIVQTTVYDSVAGHGYGGIIADSSNLELISSIAWAGNGSQGVSGRNSLIHVAYSNVSGGWNGPSIGTIDADPMFTDLSAADFHLRAGSPSIDSGMPDVDGDGLTWQTDTDDRDPDGSRIDMGALPYYREIPAAGAIAAVRLLTSQTRSMGIRVLVVPSPVRAGGTLRFTLPATSDVDLALYDQIGNRASTLASGRMEAGSQEIRFDARGLPNGLYLYRLRIGAMVSMGSVVVTH